MPPPEFVINAHLLVDCFGQWPSFHDSEVVRLLFDRHSVGGPSATLLIHAWNTLPEVDERGYYCR